MTTMSAIDVLHLSSLHVLLKAFVRIQHYGLLYRFCMTSMQIIG